MHIDAADKETLAMAKRAATLRAEMPLEDRVRQLEKVYAHLDRATIESVLAGCDNAVWKATDALSKLNEDAATEQ